MPDIILAKKSDITTLNADVNTEGSVLKSIKDNAENATYNNSTSGLTADTLGGAIDEVEGRIDGVESDIDTIKGTDWDGENLAEQGARIDVVESDIEAIKGTGWDGENLAEQGARIVSLEESAATYDSVKKITEGPFTEEGLIEFMVTLDDGIYTINTLRNGTEMFFKGSVTVENIETGLEEKSLKFARYLANGTSFEWNAGLEEWLMSAGGGGGGGGGPTVSALRLFTYPLGIPTTLFAAANSSLDLSVQYQNGLTTNGVLRVYRNGVLLELLNIQTGVTTVDIGSHVKVGSNSFDFTVSDAFGNSQTITYLVTGVSVSITSAFNDAVVQAQTGSLLFNVVAGGERYVIRSLDGIESEVAAPTITNVFNWENLEHGTHTLSLQAKSVLPSGQIIYSNTLEYLLITAEEGNTTPIIASKFNTSSAPEGSVLSVDYIAYVEGLEVVDVQFLVDGNQVGAASVDRSRKTWRVTNLGVGTHDLTIACGEVTKVHTVEITELDVEFANVEDSFLKLYLSAAQKTNADVTKEEWLPSYGDAVPVYLQNFNYQTNGWVDGGLVFNGLSSAIIVYKPFLSEVSMNGMTLEFEIETENTYGENTPFIRCMFNNRGIEIYSDRAIIRSSNSSAIAFFRENKRTKISFVIDKAQNIILTYVNGVMTGLNRIAFDSFFVQSSPQNIEVNRNYVGGTLYSFRAYQRALSPSEIMQNYLFDLPDLQTKLLEYNVSDIFDVTGEVDFDKLSARIPVMKIRAYDTDVNGNYLPETKDDKKRLFDVDFTNPFDHAKDFSAANVGIRTQGTSTLIYPVKNYRLYLPEGNDYSIDPNETRPTLILNIKTDYMESSLATNVGFCRLINDVLYDTPLPGQVADPLVRSSTYGYPIAMFLDDGNTVQFWGLYNLNTDKSDTQTFGFYDGNGFPESRKFENVRNVGNSAGAFIRKPELTDEEWFAEVVTDFEGNYPSEEGLEEATLENYQPLMDVVEFVSDYPGLDDPNIEAYKTEFAARIDVEYAIKYLLTCLVIGAVDSFGKDLMLNTWGVEGDYYKWYLTFYDLDTCVGIDNTGHMLATDGVTPKYDYDIELVDEGAFAQAESRLWDVINELFAEEVANYYATLRTGAFSFETLWHYLYDLQISKFSKGMYNANAIRKYIEAPGAENWLHMLHGDRVDQMSRWLNNRLAFLDSKYGYNKDYKRIDFRLTTADASQIEFNLTTDLHQWVEVMVGNDDSADSYGIARAKAGTPVAVRPNYLSGVGLTFVEGSIFHAERITDLGDIGINSGFSLDELRIQDAVNLLRCDLGHDTPDSHLTTFEIGDNQNLEELNLRNNSSLSGLLDLSGCPSIRKLDLRGTNYTSVTFPEGGVLEECHLPATISTVVLYNQPYLNQETFTIEDGATVDYLRVENCPGLDIISVLGKSSETVAVRILGLELSTYGAGTVDELVTLVASARGIDINGNIVPTPALYGAITVWDFDDSVDVSVYAPAFPNIVFSEMTTNTDFVVADELNSRGNCTLISYVGTDTIVEIPTAEYNAYLSETVPYVLGNYGWAPIDEIGANVFGAGISLVHLTEHIISVQNLGFSVAYTGVIVTELTAVPSSWNLSGKEVFLAQDNWELKDDLLLSVDANGVVLLRYYGDATEYALPTTITVDGVAKTSYSVSRDFFIEVAEQITELHIPTNITIIGAGLTSNLHEDALIWVMRSAKPIGWHSDWNVAGNTVYYNAPATKRTFNIYDGETLDTTFVEYGLLESDRVANAYGHGLYADELFNAEISYPYYGSGESNDLYMGPILAPVQYTYDAADGGQYYVSDFDTTRLEGAGTIRLVIDANYDDGTHGVHPVTFVAQDALGSSARGSNVGQHIGEVVFNTNLNFNADGLPPYVFYQFTNCTTFVLPAGITAIPSYGFYGCLLLSEFNFIGVQSIGDWAFYDTSITSVALQDTLTVVGESGLGSSALSYIVIYSPNTVFDTNAVNGNDNFRTAYTTYADGIYEKQGDGTWVQVSELPIDEQYFTISAEGLITSYNIAGGTDLVAPSTINDVLVVGYADHALDGVAITSLYLGQNITTIGSYAFADTAITSVIIPDTVTYIGANAFKGLTEMDISLGTGVSSYMVYADEGTTLVGHIATCEDSQFTIPENITRIKSYAFDSAYLQKLYIEKPIETLVIEDRAFINCADLLYIETYAPQSMLSLGESLFIEGDNTFKSAFEAEALHEGKGVYELLDGVWTWTNEIWEKEWSITDFNLETRTNITLGYLTPPITYPEIMYVNTIAVTGKTSINIPAEINGLPVGMNLLAFNVNGVKDIIEEIDIHSKVIVNSGTSITNNTNIVSPSLASWFSSSFGRNPVNLKVVHSIPNSVTTLASTFYSCANLTTAPNIPNSVTNMGETFYSCPNLITAPEIPNSVTSLDSTFSRCYNLTTVPNIPNSVTSMFGTFFQCYNLTTVPNIPNSVTNMANTFQQCFNLTTAPNIPNSVTNLAYTFYNCFNLTTAPNIPNSVTSLPSTFYSCINLTTAPNIPNSVTNLAYTFYNCRNLTTAPEIPNSVTILASTFSRCYNLTTVPEIPNSVTSMANTFSNCYNLTAAPNIPNSVTILAYTFSSCYNLTTAPEIPNSITILDSAFSDCSKLTTAPEIPNSVTSMAITFSGCSNLTNAPNIPNSVTNLAYTFSGCRNLTTAPEIPNSVTSMATTFSGCANLTTAPNIPNSVTNMAYTFQQCYNLTTVPNIPNSVTNMAYTFSGCGNLTTAFNISNSVTNMAYTFSSCYNLTTAPNIPNSVTNMAGTFSSCYNLTGDISIYSKQILVAGGMSNCFNGTSLPKNVFMFYTGINATHNTKAAADYSSIDGNNGVTVKALPAGLELEDWSVYKTATITETITGQDPVVYENAIILDSINVEKASGSVIIPNSINGQQVFITSNILNPINTVVEEVVFQEGIRVSNQYNTSVGNVAWTTNGNMASTIFGNASGVKTPNIKSVKGTYPRVVNMASTFRNCSNLTTAPNIPNSVTNMASAFYNCRNLNTAPEIPNSVTSMLSTFYYCTNLTNAPNIPNSVTDMAETFAGCSNLTTAPNIPNSVTNIAHTFYGCSNLTTAPNIPNSVTNMASTFYGCNKLTTAPNIPNSVTSLTNTFSNCSNLTTAPVIPNSVTSLIYTFSNCRSLTTAPEIPNSVTSMAGTFSDCRNLTTAPEIPNSVASMYAAFSSCYNLTTAPEIPNSVTSIAHTFSSCSKLTTAPNIPNSVTSMDSTFFGCSKLTTAPNIPNSVTIMSSTFSGCSNLTTASNIPNSVVSMYAAFSSCSKLISAPEIPNSVTIMSQTFSSCYNLTTAPEIPNSVTDMYRTFSQCSNLTGNVLIYSNKISYMDSCFSGTNALLPKNVYIPYTGFNATHNTKASADVANINGNDGVTVFDIDTYVG